MDKRERDCIRAARFRASLTPEELKALYAKNSARRSAKRAAKALAEGREPGKVGNPKVFTREQRKISDRETQRRFRDKNRERLREYQARKKREERATLEGALKHRAAISKLRAKRKSAPGTHTAADIRALYFEQKGRCALCEGALEEKNFHVDHWKPLSRGGSNDKSNLKLLHAKCNLMKHTKLPSELNYGVKSCS